MNFEKKHITIKYTRKPLPEKNKKNVQFILKPLWYSIFLLALVSIVF